MVEDFWTLLGAAPLARSGSESQTQNSSHWTNLRRAVWRSSRSCPGAAPMRLATTRSRWNHYRAWLPKLWKSRQHQTMRFWRRAQDADALILSGHALSEKVINGLKQCKIIALDSVGTNHVDVPAATAKGIPVTNCPDINVQEVAEHTAALILAAHRRLLRMDKMVRDGYWWEGHAPMRQLPRLYGQTLGIISFGNIPRSACAIDETLRPPPPRPRSLRQGDNDNPVRGGTGRIDRTLAAFGYRCKSSA